jgi:hypothetical protein
MSLRIAASHLSSIPSKNSPIQAPTNGPGSFGTHSRKRIASPGVKCRYGAIMRVSWVFPMSIITLSPVLRLNRVVAMTGRRKKTEYLVDGRAEAE